MIIHYETFIVKMCCPVAKNAGMDYDIGKSSCKSRA